MKYVLMTWFLTAVLSVSPTTAQEQPNITAPETGPARAVRVEATIMAPISEVWRVWTTSQGAEEFLCGEGEHPAGDRRTL
jgi:hypothetical protein